MRAAERLDAEGTFDRDIADLIDAGSSLGGARPKARGHRRVRPGLSRQQIDRMADAYETPERRMARALSLLRGLRGAASLDWRLISASMPSASTVSDGRAASIPRNRSSCSWPTRGSCCG